MYQLMDARGSVFYVGKAKNLRSRLLSYFTAPWPEAKAARLIRRAADLRWRYLPSEFAALLEELRLIRRLRPYHNVRANRTNRRLAFVTLSLGPAPKLRVTGRATDPGGRYFGPFQSSPRTAAAVRVLGDLLRLRDCAEDQQMLLADQGDLFTGSPAPPRPDGERGAACWRYDVGTCLGPCAAKCSAGAYEAQVRRAVDFLEGRTVHPIERALEAMARASAAYDFERAAAWRDKLEALEWLFGALARLRAAVDATSFVYPVRDESGGRDDRVYLIHRGLVRAEAPWPTTPVERLGFGARLEATARGPAGEAGEGGRAPAARTAAEMDELVVVMGWFRRHPEALAAARPYDAFPPSSCGGPDFGDLFRR